MSNPSTASLEKLVCPDCKALLLPRTGVLICVRCRREHPLRANIPDFLYEAHKGEHYSSWMRLPEKVQNKATAWLVENPSAWSDILFQTWWHIFAQAYESKFGIRRAIEGAAQGSRSFEEVFEWMISRVRRNEGLVLDAASGPGTIGRRIAGKQGVFAVDILLPMLKRGAALAAQERTQNIQFVRATVESLPFPNELFDGAVLGQALHWIDPTAGLSEIARVLRPGSPLSGGTALKGGSSELSRAAATTGGHPFERDELHKCLQDGGFVKIEIESAGDLLLFAAYRPE